MNSPQPIDVRNFIEWISDTRDPLRVSVFNKCIVLCGDYGLILKFKKEDEELKFVLVKILEDYADTIGNFPFDLRFEQTLEDV